MKEPNEPAAPVARGHTGQISLRVLVVDDVADVRHLAKLLLTRLGIKVVTAGGGEEALEVLENRQASAEPINAILSDFMMPMSGGELMRHVRERFPRLPFVIYSAAMTPELREQLIAAGADAALDKGTLTPQGVQVIVDTFLRSLGGGSQTSSTD